MAGGYTTEKSFYVAEGEEGELYVFLKAKNDQPQAPKIIYDGKDHAIFLRNNEQKIILDYIHPDVRDKLRKARQVVIVETILENIKDSYGCRYADGGRYPGRLGKNRPQNLGRSFSRQIIVCTLKKKACKF